MKIGYLGKQDSFAVEMIRQMRVGHSQHEFLMWLPGEKAPSLDLDVLVAIGKVGPPEWEGQTRLGLLQTASAGFDGVDVEAATKAGIWVASAPTTKTGNGESVAEFAVMLMLAASRRLNEAVAFTRENSQSRSDKPEMSPALYGKTVCIVGLGGIGDFIVERLRGFGMVLTGVDKFPEHAPKGVMVHGTDKLAVALTNADYVVLAIPGTRENENIIDKSALAAVKKGAVLINVSRGILVDESALLAAVKSGHLYGAGLDVVKDEPVNPGNALLSNPRIVVTPHIAGSTDIMLEGTVNYLGEVLARYAEGILPEGVVNQPRHPRIFLRKTA
ncbi:MAG TPA: NAD(P)-dependent oxidoreductase [Terracidiphilus sp.]|jgi:phosphoglycerate dehydrogenase-like enzyme